MVSTYCTREKESVLRNRVFRLVALGSDATRHSADGHHLTPCQPGPRSTPGRCTFIAARETGEGKSVLTFHDASRSAPGYRLRASYERSQGSRAVKAHRNHN